MEQSPFSSKLSVMCILSGEKAGEEAIVKTLPRIGSHIDTKASKESYTWYFSTKSNRVLKVDVRRLNSLVVFASEFYSKYPWLLDGNFANFLRRVFVTGACKSM